MSERHREVQFWRLSSVVTLYLCSVRDLSKDAAKQKQAFHVDSLVIRIQSPRLASVPAPTVFYVGQTGRQSQ